jgi:hypothetical protein
MTTGSLLGALALGFLSLIALIKVVRGGGG